MQRCVRVLVSASAFAAAVGTVAWLAMPATGTTVGGARRVATDVARHVFLRDCATCHGSDARGTDLAPTLQRVGAAKVDYYLSTGRMPLVHVDAKIERHPPKYRPAMIDALVSYVATLVGGGGPDIPKVNPARGDLATGGEVFRLNCAACHAWSGDGGALQDRQAPPVHAATPTQIAEAVRSGPGTMPAFGAQAITQRQLDGVVRYVHTLNHPADRGGTPLWHLGPMAEGAVGVVLGLGALVLAVRWIGTRT